MIDQTTGVARYETADGVFLQKELSTGAMRAVSVILGDMKLGKEMGLLVFSTDSETLARLFSAVLTTEGGSPVTITSEMVDGWPWDRITNQMVTDFFVFAPTLTTFINTFAGAMLSSEMTMTASADGKGPNTGSISH